MRVLTARNLAKSFNGRKVVQDTSLTVRSGQIVGLLGPNGAGKTTSFYMIIGMIKPDAGKVMLDDEDLSQAPMHIRARKGIGYLPQEASIFRKLSVADKPARVAKLETLLQEFHLTPIRNSLGMSLSGGERRRAEIARALATEPAFILLDEPFAGVDPISVNDIKTIIRSLSARGIGVLITDHNVRETLDICELAYIVNAGSVLAEGTTEQILQNRLVREVYLGEQFRM